MEQTQSKKRLGALPLALCGLFTALVAIGAFLQIPVPYFDYFTLQFLFVVLAGMFCWAEATALYRWGYMYCWGWRAFPSSPPGAASAM